MGFLNNEGLTHLWSIIKAQLGNKVDKEAGKVLSTNDYTTAENNKLAGIATGANKTVVDSSLSSSSTNPVQNKVVNSAISNLNALVGNTAVSTQISNAITAQKGAASGLATLDESGKILSTQLPSYVDDVLEGYLSSNKFYKTKASDGNYSNEMAGETGKIYVDLNTNKTYRWSGSAFVVIFETLALGETASTAYRGDRGKAAYDHAAAKGAAFNSGLYKITTNAQGHVTAATAVAKADITGLGIPAQDTTYSAATTSKNGLMSSSDKTKLNGIANGAEVNQNAFSNIVVGSTTVAADSKTDTLTFTAGKNITLTPDTTNDAITIAAADVDVISNTTIDEICV